MNSTFPVVVVAVAPTLSLPILKRLEDHSSEIIGTALTNLRVIYSSSSISFHRLMLPKLTSRRSHLKDSILDSGYASAEEEDVESWISENEAGNEEKNLDLLRADAFERTFTIKWLTGFIARGVDWIETANSDEEVERRGSMVDEAACLLSACAGSEEACPDVTRSFAFPRKGGARVEVQLNDAPLSLEDHTSVGLQSWASSIVLAQRMCADPSTYFRSSSPKSESRILELGAGTGLLSIAAAKLLDPPAAIVATDYHPAVLCNLRSNVTTNLASHSSRIEVQPLDWQFPPSTPPFDRPFDTIVAADVIYHPEHAQWIRNCAEKYLAQPHGVLWLIIPWRSVGRHENIGETVPRVFSPREQVMEQAHALSLQILTKERIRRQDGVGRADEAGYTSFQIGWVP